MKQFTKFTDIFCNYVSYLSMIAIVFMAGYMGLDVFLRTALNKPMLGGYEVTTMILCILVFTSWSYAQTQHAHIHVTMFIRMFPPKLRFISFGLMSLLSTFVLGLMTYAVFVRLFEIKKMHTTTGMLLIPYWPFVLIEAIALCIFTLILLRDTIKAILAIVKPAYAEEIMATWEG